MTWQWVVLILGIVSLIVLLFVVVAWTSMKTKFYESIPRTLPEMMGVQKKDD
jgi:uncharacterized integral membrane protein